MLSASRLAFYIVDLVACTVAALKGVCWDHFRKNAITVFSYSNTVNFFFCDKTQLSKTFRMVFLCSNTIMNHFRKNANTVFSLFLWN
jgi:hypothetical protein